MHDRDELISSLTAIARRMRFNMVLREWAWAACFISSTFLVYQIFAALIAAPPVLNALTALLVLLGVVIIGFYLARSVRPFTLAQAAAESDGRANLNDELKSAYWFARQPESSSLISLQIHHAVRTARGLNPSKLFETVVPRSAFAAFGLAIVAGLLAWVAPRVEYSASPRLKLTSNAVIPTRADLRPGRAPQSPARDEERSDRQDGAVGNPTNADWTKLETAVKSLGQGDESAALATAIKARDAARVTQLLEELGRKRDFARAQAPARAAGNVVPASQELLTRLQEIFGPGGNAPQPQQEASTEEQLALAVKLVQKLDQDAKTRANNPANHTAEEATTNPLQAGVALERRGPRETRRSENQSGEFAGTTDVEGGAMGRRVTQTTAGAGGKPSPSENSDNNNIQAESVFGKATMRLAAKLERLKIESNKPEDSDKQGVSDGQFAATRAQQAQLNYQNAPQQARYVSENAMSGERVPLAYRGAVKDYFLNLNRKEP